MPESQSLHRGSPTCHSAWQGQQPVRQGFICPLCFIYFSGQNCLLTPQTPLHIPLSRPRSVELLVWLVTWLVRLHRRLPFPAPLLSSPPRRSWPKGRINNQADRRVNLEGGVLRETLPRRKCDAKEEVLCHLVWCTCKSVSRINLNIANEIMAKQTAGPDGGPCSQSFYSDQQTHSHTERETALLHSIAKNTS